MQEVGDVEQPVAEGNTVKSKVRHEAAKHQFAVESAHDSELARRYDAVLVDQVSAGGIVEVFDQAPVKVYVDAVRVQVIPRTALRKDSMTKLPVVDAEQRRETAVAQ